MREPGLTDQYSFRNAATLAACCARLAMHKSTAPKSLGEMMGRTGNLACVRVEKFLGGFASSRVAETRRRERQKAPVIAKDRNQPSRK